MRINSKNAFSLIEVLITMVFLSLAFLPLYNLFQFGQKGTTNNLQEVAATNYASDMINFVRDIKFYDFEKAAGSVENFRLANDDQIAAFFKRINNLKPPPACEKPFSRSMEVRKFKGRDSRGPVGVIGWISDLINKRRAVPNYLVTVKVEFPRQGGGEKDKVQLYTIVMD
ncbi:MAG: hypothetical protein PWR01_3525 [Clostridiales bacterium]|jgi:hypothetical protein|nr:hypothetical protein [Clostridiales bacterium]MDN5282452.1 hypothetical protein [Candidatus Ozemobacter sp.]